MVNVSSRLSCFCRDTIFLGRRHGVSPTSAEQSPCAAAVASIPASPGNYVQQIPDRDACALFCKQEQA